MADGKAKNGGRGISPALVISAGFIILGLTAVSVALLPSAIDSFRDARIRAGGRLTTATIISSQQTGIWIGNSPRVRLRVRVDLPDRGSFETETTLIVPLTRAASMTPGSKIAVYYDPAVTERVAAAE